MSSSPIFPLLILPRLAFEKITKFWIPYEIYNFAMISKRTRFLARQMSEKPETVLLCHFPMMCTYIEFPPDRDHSGRWYFSPHQNPREVQVNYLVENQSFRHFRFYSENPGEKVLEVLDNVIDIFNNPLKIVSIDASMPRNYFNLLIDRINTSSQNQLLKRFTLTCSETDHLVYFLTSNVKKTKTLMLCPGPKVDLQSSRSSQFLENSSIRLYEQLMIIHLRMVNSCILTVLDVVEMEIYSSFLTNQYLNDFLKSWVSGNTNSRLRRATLKIEEKINLRVVLQDIPFIKRDPRTTKRYLETELESCWIFGGYDVQLSCGRTATIQWHKYTRKRENSKLPELWVRKYEDEDDFENNIDQEAPENVFKEPEDEQENLFEHQSLCYLHTLSVHVW